MRANWQVAWVTGASTGLGRELALELARLGVEVAASARSADKLQALAKDNVWIEAYPVDVTDAEAVEKTVASIENGPGPIDLAILNAGIAAPFNPQQVDLAAIRAAWETNYMGVVNGLAAVAPRMIARRRGRIAIVASVAGYRGRPRMGGYAPTKAALINLAECLRADLEPFGVSVSIINPGYIDTPLTRQNRFAMPFLLSADDAAKRVLAGLKRGSFEIAFPWQLVWMLKFMRSLPYPAYFSWLRSSGMKKTS